MRHPNDAFDKIAYVVRVLAEEWRKRDIPVEFTTRADGPVGADVLVIPHLDLTVTPQAYREFFTRCAIVLNRDVTDISKRKISRNLITSPKEFDGPVIVKTNRNAAGGPETSKTWHQGGMKRRLLQLARRLPWTLTGLIGPLDYKIYNHPRLVPGAVWYNRRLVVEKFLAERQGDLYGLRQYTFLGSSELNTLAWSADPIVKAHGVLRREVLPDTPPALRKLRVELGFDYGKFDYVMHDGQAILFDANRTPTYNAASKAGSASPLIAALARGIDAFVGGT